MKRLLVFPSALFLSGCLTLVSVPLDETVNLLVTGYSDLVSRSVEDLEPCELRYPLRSVCIEYNPTVSITDFVPSLQRRFGQLRVESALYAPGTLPVFCDTTLRYVAVRNWSNHFASSDKQSYLGEAELFLYRDGKLQSTTRFQSSRLGYEKWTATSSKIDPVIDELVCKKKS